MRIAIQTLAMLGIALFPITASADEICSNGLDDDSDGLLDEGCMSPIAAGYCESPLSCSDTGIISPKSGSLHYALQPDIAPRVPYGANIGFRRFYTSMYAPQGGIPIEKKPLGERWQHTYMTWIVKTGNAPSSTLVIHTSEGRDIRATFSKSELGYDYYTPQVGGGHYQYIRQRQLLPPQIPRDISVQLGWQYEIKLLTGETLIYSHLGLLIEIHDALVVPNKVLLAYGNNQLLTVTDASGLRRLLFSYSSSKISSLEFQIQIATIWTTQHTTSYSYTSGNLTGVTIGGVSAQTNVYTSSYLTSIQDGASNALVNFVYDGTTAGKIVRVDTPRGVIGWEFNSSRSNCSGNTVLHFHKANTTSCTADSDCGTGNLCGGKTGAGSTGQCFRGARCLTISSPSEDVVTAVTAFAGSSETCDGACLDAIDHVWDTTGNKLDLTAVQDPSSHYTVKTFDDNGMPTRIIYGDTDSDPSNGGGQREVFITYDSIFPGKVAETRRKSDLLQGFSLPDPINQQIPACSPTTPHGCVRTLYQYDMNGKLIATQQHGFTLGPKRPVVQCEGGCEVSTDCLPTHPDWPACLSSSPDSDSPTEDPSPIPGMLDGYKYLYRYLYTTTYSYDPQGRLIAIDGPLPGPTDMTTFDYWSMSDELRNGFLKSTTRSTGLLPLTSKTEEHDFWGNPTTLLDPNGVVTCLTFDTARGYLAQRRETMAGQANCTGGVDPADLVTNWERDSAVRLTKTTTPDGSCLIYEYDTRGRLSKTKRRDDCTAASSGDREEYTYSTEGLVTKIETFNASSVVTKRQELTYFDSRRLAKVLNPVDTAKWTGFTYEARGLVSDVATTNGSTNYSRSSWTYNADSRVVSESRYRTTSAFDTWNLLFDWIGNQLQVTDGESKATKTLRDDLGRVVKLESPDLGGFPTLRVYDEGSRLVAVKESLGGPAEQTHIFTYDGMGRSLAANYHGDCSAAPGGLPEIQRVYDALPTSLACPTVGCAHLEGRLAYVKVRLMCTSEVTTFPDGSIDQETFYSYDAAGRVVREFIRDDSAPPPPPLVYVGLQSTRNAHHVYTWTKNGALAQVTLPSTAVIGFTHGSSGSNSDADRTTAIWRTSTATPIIDEIKWFPYGPLQQYNQQNTSASSSLRTKILRNLAYRITETRLEKQSDSSLIRNVAITEDEKGRVILRNYDPNTIASQTVGDSYFTYDLQDRVVCETTTNVSGSCPSSGSNIKNSHDDSPPFSAAGDWKTLKRPIPGSTGLNHAFSYFSGTHQLSFVTQSDGSPTLGNTWMEFDGRGNRSAEDNTSSLTNDRRDYSYDARRNLTNVHGQYYTGSAWHEYDVASAFDAKNRRVFKSFSDNTTGTTATWFFYYDALDRLSEVRHTPDTSASGTYSIFQLAWLGDQLVLYWQTDYPSGTTSKRYVSGDESGRPIDMMSWPSSGAAVRVWAINPDAWGNDTNLVGPSVFQPILFAGQYKDDETTAWQNDGITRHRPGLVLNGYRTYDPFIGGYLQVDPLVPNGYYESDPVGKSDLSELGTSQLSSGNTHQCPMEISSFEPQGQGSWNEQQPDILMNHIRGRISGECSSGDGAIELQNDHTGPGRNGGDRGYGACDWIACGQCYTQCWVPLIQANYVFCDDIWCWLRSLWEVDECQNACGEQGGPCNC